MTRLEPDTFEVPRLPTLKTQAFVGVAADDAVAARCGAQYWRRDGKRLDLLVAIAWGVHPFPSRTR